MRARLLPMRGIARLLPCGVAVTVAVACSDDQSREGPSFSVRDSAGIPVVENTRPRWHGAEGWRVDSVPTLVISAADDPDLFRISSPRHLSDGRIVFFNGGNCEVRAYSGEGRPLVSAGRCGEGPGEFDQYARLWQWTGDSLLVVDRLTRISILAGDGSFGRPLRLPSDPAMPLPLVRGVLEDGTLVLASLRDPVGRSTPGVESGELIVGALASNDDTLTMLGSYPGPTFEYAEFGGSLGRGRLAFSASTALAAGDSRIFVGFPERYEIRVYTARGGLQRVIRRSFAAVAVERRDIDWLMRRRLGQVEGEQNQRAVRQAYRDLNHAVEMPAFGVPVWPGGAEGGPPMIADEEGNLWVFAHYRPGEYRNRWDVFSPDGEWLGEVDFPRSFVPSQIARDFVIGVRTDDDGFQRVERYAIHEGTEP